MLPIALAAPPVFAQTDGATDSAGDSVDGTTDTGADTGADTGGSDTGGTDTGMPAEAPRDAAPADAAANPDAPRTDGGSSSDDEGDCGCRLGGAGRSSATLPLLGALAGLGFVVRKRTRRTRPSEK